MLRIAACSFLRLLLCAGNASAMIMRVYGNQIVLSGPVLNNDGDRFATMLDDNPNVDTVILHNSPGGSGAGMNPIARTINERGMTTGVSGNCASACALIFMSGKERYFADAEGTDVTSIGFHGGYSIEGYSVTDTPRAIRTAQARFARITGGKIDPALVARWVALPENGLVRFRYPGADGTPREPTVFECEAALPNHNDYSSCQPIPGVDALSMGIITSTRILHVNR